MYIVILMYIVATTPKLASGHSSFSKEIPNACLRDALFWKRHVSNRFECETLCLMLRMCQSVNYRTTDRICHINFKKAYDVHSVVLEKGTTYIRDRKNKTSTPCRWGTCKVNEICAVVQRTNKLCLPFDATKDCDNDSGRLIILNTSDKHKRIVRELLENYGGPRYYFQVGGKKEASGDWVWLNGNVIDSTGPHWFPGNPNGDGICMDLMIKNSIDGLNDYSCRSPISFICEILI
ncbi:uncharacterized protein [Haliotis cracherodii]|uniref:uncharacterized protein n=1 Tax=Haliotis cracherodii TaxID=6455 RepID=UPI0039E8D39F